MRWPWQRRKLIDGPTAAQKDVEMAAAAAIQARRRLRQARADWPKVYESRDILAELIDQALRGGAR